MAKAAKAAKATTLEIFDCPQQSEEWFALRTGLPTASKFGAIMAKGEGKMRTRYMRELAGEIITGKPAETYSNANMERGRVMEDEAREHYAIRRFDTLTRVGFVKNSGLMKYAVVGASPDSLVDRDGGLEIKTMIPALMIELLEGGARMPPEHRAQVHGNMWVCEREWWDLKIYWPRMPDFTVRVARDDTFIREISDEVERFSFELKKLVDRLRSMGAAQ